MKQVLAEIQDGTFASTFVQEMNAGGKAKFLTSRKKAAASSAVPCRQGTERNDELAEKIRFDRYGESLSIEACLSCKRRKKEEL